MLNNCGTRASCVIQHPLLSLQTSMFRELLITAFVIVCLCSHLECTRIWLSSDQNCVNGLDLYEKSYKTTNDQSQLLPHATFLCQEVVGSWDGQGFKSILIVGGFAVHRVEIWVLYTAWTSAFALPLVLLLCRIPLRFLLLKIHANSILSFIHFLYMNSVTQTFISNLKQSQKTMKNTDMKTNNRVEKTWEKVWKYFEVHIFFFGHCSLGLLEDS